MISVYKIKGVWTDTGNIYCLFFIKLKFLEKKINTCHFFHYVQFALNYQRAALDKLYKF